VYTGKLEPLAQAAAMLAGHELDSLSKKSKSKLFIWYGSNMLN